MLDRLERHLDRIVNRAHFGLLARFNSELDRITEDKERRWALWYAVADLPTWHRSLLIVVIVLVGPLTLTSAVLGFAMPSHLSTSVAWTVVGPLAWAAGMVLTAALIEGLRQRQVRSRCRRAMRVFGHDICTGCGYDMTGHEVVASRARTCPECGCCVPPLATRGQFGVGSAAPHSGQRTSEPVVARTS